ncbi:urease accessory protein UreD [Profundibacterium mesophilum]|uniref:urease accessory protein UreD n=1 Tax=Profundibacterium mesophilum TaxID=1258573 RepID=UPI002E2D96A7|nr:urease accessory protein UreD [Profundibacterium mesophilum]
MARPGPNRNFPNPMFFAARQVRPFTVRYRFLLRDILAIRPFAGLVTRRSSATFGWFVVDGGKRNRIRWRQIIILPSSISLHGAVPAQPRAIGAGRVCVAADETGRTRLVDLRQSGSTRLVFPRVHRLDAEVILVNTAGGITGGDSFSLELALAARARLTLTTQAAERAYRAQPNEIGSVDTRIDVASGARLNWLPQELILFERSALRRRLHIDLAPGAELLMVEPVVFGRAAMGETLRDIFFHDRIRITRDGTPLYIDAMRLSGDASGQLRRPAIANGAGAMASVVLVHPGAAGRLPRIRAALPATAGASLIAPDTLVLRLLAEDSFALRRSLLPLLDHLTDNTLPTSWRL